MNDLQYTPTNIDEPVTGIPMLTVLAPVDHAAFFDALDAPPLPAEKLRRAFARHQNRVLSK